MNYKSFGFTKFIPRIPKEKFEAVVKASPNSPNALGVWESACVHDVGTCFIEADDSHSSKNTYTLPHHLRASPSENAVSDIFRIIILAK